MEDRRCPLFQKSSWDFGKLLYPYDEDAFLRDTLSQSYLHVPGHPEKFSDLFGWSALNYVLSNTALRSPHLRITRGDLEESPALFFRDPDSGSALRLPELSRLLLDGTILTIDSIEEVHPPLAEVCSAIEVKLGIPVLQTQAHATFSPAPGPGVRWNDHDMFVLQFVGSRSWTIYGPTKDRGGQGRDGANPPTEVVWSHTLEAGDLLYIPRNWWYVENSFDTAALDFAIGFRNPTGIELAARVIETLVHSETMAADYPRFQSEEVQAFYLAQIQQEIELAFTEPGLILGYFKDVRTLAAPRRLSGLPWSILGAESIPGNCVIISTLRFPGPETRIRNANGNFIDIVHDGNAIQVNDCLEPVLQAIFDEGGYSIEMLIDRYEKEIPRDSIITLLGDLLRLGLVIAHNPVDSA